MYCFFFSVVDSNRQVRLQRFACLEVLLLDDNNLMDMAVFAALAGLPKYVSFSYIMSILTFCIGSRICGGVNYYCVVKVSVM